MRLFKRNGSGKDNTQQLISTLTESCKQYRAHLEKVREQNVKNAFVLWIEEELRNLKQARKANKVGPKRYSQINAELNTLLRKSKSHPVSKGQDGSSDKCIKALYDKVCLPLNRLNYAEKIPAIDVFERTFSEKLLQEEDIILTKKINAVNSLLSDLKDDTKNATHRLAQFKTNAETAKDILSQRRSRDSGFAKFWAKVNAILTKLNRKDTTTSLGVTGAAFARRINRLVIAQERVAIQTPEGQGSRRSSSSYRH